MKKKVYSLFAKIGSLAAGLALVVAAASCGMASAMWLHQPKVPASLIKK